MLGYDLWTFWSVGRAILNGASPYSVFNIYPPAAAFFFILPALLPFNLAFGLWSGINILFVVDTLRRLRLGRRGLIWLLFAPVVFIILTGQLDLAVLWLAALLPLGGWPAVTAAVLITLKPQAAVILLPWFLLRWLRSDRRLLWLWLGAAAVLHALPLLFSPTIYSEWLAALPNEQLTYRASVSSGIFGLLQLQVPFWPLAVVALALMVWGWLQSEPKSRAAQLFAFPYSLWYADAYLIGAAPAWLLIPVSWLAFLVSYLLKSGLPMAVIALAALVWSILPVRPAPPPQNVP